MGLDSAVRSALRHSARHLPQIYNWRNQHNVLIQRFRGGVHDQDFACLAEVTVERPLVVDVGANTGQTLQTVKTLLPTARLVCIEPSALVLAALIRTAARYKEDVEVASFAAGGSFGSATISTPVAAGIIFTQFATLTEMDKSEVASTITQAGFPNVTQADIEVRKSRCVVAPLDEIVDRCDVLKVDVEGFEDSVFAGARRLVQTCRPLLIIERPSSDLADYLEGLGYEPLPTASSVNTVQVHPTNMLGIVRN